MGSWPLPWSQLLPAHVGVFPKTWGTILGVPLKKDIYRSDYLEVYNLVPLFRETAVSSWLPSSKAATSDAVICPDPIAAAKIAVVAAPMSSKRDSGKST